MNESYKGFSPVATFCDEIVANHAVRLGSNADTFLAGLIRANFRSVHSNANRDGGFRRVRPDGEEEVAQA